MPFTPVGGARFLVARGQDRAAWVAALGRALQSICEDNELSGVHVNFCARDEIEPLRELGFELRIGVQYHWHNWTDPIYVAHTDDGGGLRWEMLKWKEGPG